MPSPVPRPLGVAAAGLVLALGATACAESEAGSSPSTVLIQPSSYVTKPVVTTTSTVPGTVAEGRSPVEQQYTVEPGDYPVLIAQRYDVDLDELRNYNDWEDDYGDFPGAGGIVKIPPGAKVPIEEPEEAETTERRQTDDTDQTDSTTAPAANGPCDPGTYEIEPNDYPILVADRFDVTLEALAQANGWTPPNYQDFPPAGTEIIIPPGSDCPE
jgi:LysM repeat protein